MTYETTLKDMAVEAWRKRQDARDPLAKALAEESVFRAEDFVFQTFGRVPVDLLTWEADQCVGGEVNAARADLPDTPGWYLRWSLGPEHHGPALMLHRPCAEGGHRNRIHSLAGLGAHLAALADR
ncbi:hypothetical protein ACFV4P_03045 [Kitasatospora sp. NPDC059795]|uniref:hypothetical protein n=1 Tax=Kitasatospora sp. NPDC059795 TaxID=3346949 RepID=UPI0036492B94